MARETFVGGVGPEEVMSDMPELDVEFEDELVTFELNVYRTLTGLGTAEEFAVVLALTVVVEEYSSVVCVASDSVDESLLPMVADDVAVVLPHDQLANTRRCGR